MTPPAAHAALLLAAGGSRRLGQPKALLRRDGVSLVRHVAQLLLDTQPAGLVVVLGADGDTIGAALDGLPVQRTHNPDWAHGLSTSLRRGADLLADRDLPVLIATVDQLALDASHLHALLHADPATDAVSGYADTRGVPARVSPATLRRAHTLTGDRGFGAHWQATAPTVIDAARLAFDLDTPDDLARAIAAGLVDPQ